MKPRAPVVLRKIAFSLALVSATTAGGLLIPGVNATTAGFAYLLNILALAAAWGLVEAVVASAAAMLCFNYFFLPPVGRFTIAEHQNWVALFAFLATALVASHLSDRAKKQTLEAKGRQRETEQLYALSRAILLTNATQSIGFQAAQHIAQIFDCRAAVLYDAKAGDLFRGGLEDLPDIEPKLKQVVIQGSTLRDPASDLMVAAVTLGGNPIGSLALKGISLSDGALQALLNLVAIAFERVRTEEAASRAEVARQNEEFKSTLLDAIAHEFKTPLTSIKAAATSMLSDPSKLSDQHGELATIIDEEADRLSLLVTEAVRMSEIDAGKVRLDRRPHRVREIVEHVLEHFGARLEGRALALDVPEDLPSVWVDDDLIALALRQLIDNGLKYSPPASPIVVTAAAGDNSVLIRVLDRGPGIPDRDRERVFDKYYRRQTAKDRVPGTGLGLYIAREIVRTHGGDLRIEGEPGAGSEFCMSLPATEERALP
ncbi:MAG: ATP-binding protein [Bryobacteraceae bacterium]